MQALQGYRTYIVGFLMAIAPVGLQYLAGIDWTKLIGPNAAMMVAGIVTIALRSITTTPPGQKP